MKKFKRILSLVLAGSLIFLAACGNAGYGSDSSGVADGSNGSGGGIGASNLGENGRYVEIDISPPIEGRFTGFLGADGEIICFDADLTMRYESHDNGETWSATPGPFAGSGNPYFLLASTLLPDGSILAFDFEEGLIQIFQDGKTEPYLMSEIDYALNSGGGMVNISLLQYLSDNKLLMSYSKSSGSMMSRTFGTEETDDEDAEGDNDAGGSHIENVPEETDDESEYDSNVFSHWESKTLLIDMSTGEIINDLSVEHAIAAVSDETHLFLMDFGGLVTTYNLHDGSHSGKTDISFMSNDSTGSGEAVRMFGGFGGSQLLALRNDGAVYSVMGGELLLADTDGSLSTVLDRSAYAIGTPRNIVDSIFVLDDDSLVINITSNGQNNTLYKYIWDENATFNPDKTLTIWSLEDNSFVRAAIAEMRKRHPDATIIYDVALDGASAMSASDAIRNLNTRLLGGDAPDVIILDGVAVNSYVDRGMMLDLSQLLDFEDVYSNLLSSFLNDGKLYCLPMQLTMPVLMGSSDALDKAQTIDAFVETIVSGNNNPLNLERDYDPFATLDDSQKSEIFFDDLRELYEFLWVSAASGIVNNNALDSNALRRYLEIVKAISDRLELADDHGSDDMFAHSVVLTDGSSENFLQGSLTRYFMNQTNYAVFMAKNLMVLRIAMEMADSDLMVFPGFDPGVWQPSTIAGISADTGNAGFAAEFLQTMLSKEVQHLNYGTGLPVTRSGLDAQVESVKDMRTGSDAEFTFDVDSIIDRLQTVSMVDAVLVDMIWDSVERFCKGATDIEGALSEIEQNIRTYLAERA